MNAIQRAILGLGLLAALVLVLLPPWQSTHFTQDQQTRAPLVIGPSPEPYRIAWLFWPPETGYQFHNDEKLEVWFICSVDWSRLAALLLVDALACGALIVLFGYGHARCGLWHPRKPASQDGATFRELS